MPMDGISFSPGREADGENQYPLARRDYTRDGHPINKKSGRREILVARRLWILFASTFSFGRT
jgi:hypothetical protein